MYENQPAVPTFAPTAPAAAPQPTQTQNPQEVYKVAHQLFNQNPDWVTFFREVLGLEGVVRQAYAEPERLASFERSEEYTEIQQMLAKLRDRKPAETTAQEPTRVITVRMPQSLHESLKAESHERRTSMNKLCITKLLQTVEDNYVPHDA